MKPSLSATVTAIIAVPLLTLLGSAPPAVAGPPAGAEFRVNTRTTGVEERPAIAMDAQGDYAIAWEAYDQDGDQLGVYAQRYAADGTPQGNETRINTTTTNSQQDPSIAMDADGDYVVTWDSGLQDGSGTGVYAQRFSADGTPLGTETRVNTTTADTQHGPRIAMDADGDYVITWMSYLQDGSNYGVYAQRYNAAGVPQGVETQVNTTTADAQKDPSVAMDAEGDYVITWQSVVAGGSAIEFQRYDADGTPEWGETQANTTPADGGTHPNVAMAADGTFVITWASQAEGPTLGNGVYARRFTAGGTPVGSEAHVNTTTSYDQDLAAVAMAADGGYAITWESYLQDGSDYGIFTRRFSAAGASVGGETRANTFTTGEQRQPAIAMDADGDVVVGWTSYAQDGDLYGVYARRFRSPSGVDLALTQSEDADPVAVGEDVTYRVLVANQEEASVDTGVPAIDAAVGAATGVYVVSTIPEGAEYVTGSGRGWDCTAFDTLVRCRLGSPLAADHVAPPLSLTYTAPKEAGPALHRARVYEQQLDPDSTDDTETERTSVRCSIELASPSYPTLEAGSLSVLVTRHGSGCGASTVQYETASGTATEGVDFSGVADTLVWADADTDRTFLVPITPDSIDEKTEQLKLRLSSPTGALLGARTLAVGTIADNDPPPRINFTTATSAAAEPGALVHLTVELSEESGQPVTVDLNRAGTASAGSDYFSATKLTIPAGRTSVSFTVEVVDDLTVEPAETAVITLAAPVGATLGSLRTHRLTITSND